MSDPYSFDPFDNVINLGQRTAFGNVFGAQDANPDQAAQASKLAPAMGLPPEYTYDQFDKLEPEFKRRLGGRIVQGSPELQAYADAHPLAAKVSNDDWGPLADAMEKTKAAMRIIDAPGFGAVPMDLPPALRTIGEEAGKGFASQYQGRTHQFRQEVEQQASKIATQGGTLAKLQAAIHLAGWGTMAEGADLTADAMGIVTGAIIGGTQGIGAVVSAITGQPAATKVGEEIGHMIQDPALAMSLPVVGELFHLPFAMADALRFNKALKANVEAAKQIAEFDEAVRVVTPYILEEKEIPNGIHPLIDKLRAEQAEIDAKKFDEAQKAVQSTSTYARAKDFSTLALRQLPSHEIGISSDAIRKLYGEEQPTPGDGLLGDVVTPEALVAAEENGGFVKVPAADWLTKVERDVAKGLLDDVRFRPSGVSKAEAKAMVGEGEPQKVEIPDQNAAAIANIRKAASLDLEGRQASIAAEVPERGELYVSPEGSAVHVVPSEAMTAAERDVATLAKQTLDRILGKDQVDIKPADKIQYSETGGLVQGLNINAHDMMPVIAYAIGGAKVPRIVRHEAIHQLRNWGLITPEEWAGVREAALAKSAEGKDWLDKHSIRERYAEHKMDEDALIEEAFAEEFGEWGALHEKADAQVAGYAGVQGAFEKVFAYFQELYKRLSEYFGHPPQVEELFNKIEEGEVGRRPRAEPTEGAKAAEKEPELPGVTRMEDRRPFSKGMAIGLTEPIYKRILALIEKQRAEDQEYLAKKYVKEAEERSKPEWKAKEKEIWAETAANVQTRPDVAASKVFDEGTIRGVRMDEKPKLGRQYLTPEQEAGLPKEWITDKKGGVSPDAVARAVGFHTGDDMIEALSQFAQDRAASGMRPSDYIRRLIAADVERRVERELGEYNKNIIDDAMEHVASDTAFELLHEETLAAALKAGEEFPITKEQFAAGTRQGMDASKAAGISSKELFEDAGRAGRAVVEATTKGDNAEVFRQWQRQYASLVKAKEALKVEKEIKRFEKNAKKYAKQMKVDRERKVAPEYENFVYQLYSNLGFPIGRSEAHLAEGLDMEGHRTIGELIESKQQHYPSANDESFFDLPIADYLRQGEFKKPFEELSLKEFRDVSAAVKALEKQGRSEQRLTTEGNDIDRREALDRMTEQVVEVGRSEKTRLDESNLAKHALRRFLAGFTNFETVFNRFDRNDPRGLFNQYLVRPVTSAANTENALIKEVAKPYQALGELKDPDKLMDSPLNDPVTGRPLANFTRSKGLAILQNMGNDSNWKALTRGYGLDEEGAARLKQWVFQHFDYDDFKRAQQMGETVFEPLFKKAKTVYYNLYGTIPEEIPLTGVPTPWRDAEGNQIVMKGWYHPLIRDPYYETKGYIEATAPDMKPKFKPAQTLNGYMQPRTGAVYPIDLTFDRIPQRISEIIHDISFRPAIVEATKILKDEKLRDAIALHYGEEYRDMLNPFLQSMAGMDSINTKEWALATKLSEYVRQNTITTLVGFNPMTMAKHGPSAWVNSMAQVGGRQFIRAFKDATSDLYGKSPEEGLSWREYVDKYSEEVGRRKRHFNETIGGVHADIYGKGTTRERFMETASSWVAWSDMVSARPTWLAAYRNAIKYGMDHGQAVFEGDRAVRFAHGSTAITNLPSYVRGAGPIGKWSVSLYGFFGTMLQRRIQLAHELNDLYHLGREGELKQIAKNLPGFANRLFAFVIWPSIVEEAVSGYGTDDHRGWGTRIAVGAMIGISNAIPYARDIVWPLMHGHAPEFGMLGVPLKGVSKVVRKMGQAAFDEDAEVFSKEHAGQLVEDYITALGELRGLGTAHLGKAAHYGIDVLTGVQRPQGLADVLRGTIRGTQEVREEE